MTTVRPVIDFIIEEGQELEKYPALVPKLREKFIIKDLNGREAAEELITAVIFWENHTEIYDSLEKFLADRFISEKRA